MSPVVNFALQAWLSDDLTPPTAATVPGANDLPATATPASVTISHRPQRLMVVLDRTGSMLGDKWSYATTAARIMTHLFTAIRAGASARPVKRENRLCMARHLTHISTEIDAR